MSSLSLSLYIYIYIYIYIWDMYCFHPKTIFHIFSQPLYLLNFSGTCWLHNLFFSPQYAMYFIMLSFLIYKIFKFYTGGLEFKCFDYAAKGLRKTAHILFVPLKRAECEMHVLACVLSHRQRVWEVNYVEQGVFVVNTFIRYLRKKSLPYPWGCRMEKYVQQRKNF